MSKTADYLDARAEKAESVAKDPHNREADAYNLAARILREAAAEVRQGLHYDREAAHQALSDFFADIHARNVAAGWWTDIKTGAPAVRNVGEMLTLVHSEISEAYEGYRKNRMDDHLPMHPQLGVELGDALIRIGDMAGALMAGRLVSNDGATMMPPADVACMVFDKLAYNATRADHKLENRLKDDGKKT